MHRSAKLTAAAAGAENMGLRGGKPAPSGRSASAQPAPRKPGLPSQAAAASSRAGLASSGLGRSGLGAAPAGRAGLSTVRGAGASSRVGAAAAADGAHSAPAAAAAGAGAPTTAADLVSPTRMRTMSKAAALGLPSIVDAVRAGCALRDEGLYGAGYAGILAQEWGVKKASEGSKVRRAGGCGRHGGRAVGGVVSVVAPCETAVPTIPCWPAFKLAVP